MIDALQLSAPTLVSIVMRTVGGRPREIRRAIASVATNTWLPLEVVVVYQGADDAQWADLQRLPAEFPALPVRLVHNAGTGDRRAENLNLGWETAQGRYLGFLDDDDTLKPNHVAQLVRAMQSSGHAWAYAQVVLRKEDEALNMVNESHPFRRHAFSLKSLWIENFLPIHSFLIDRVALNEAMRVRPFHEELDRSEDWDFLLRLAFYHEPAVVEEFTATYHVSTGARNTNLSLINTAGDEECERRNREAWAKCKSIVEQRKAELITQMWWAREYFAPEVAPVPQPASSGSRVRRPISERIIRKLIRILERLL
jgi:glycosyltransferase involved in cell wall biosynthesis